MQKKKKVMKGKIIASVLHMYIFSACVRVRAVLFVWNEYFAASFINIWWRKMASYTHPALQIAFTMYYVYEAYNRY